MLNPENKQLMTPHEYLMRCLSKYPILYSRPTLDGVRLCVFGQLFNVIGNGVRCNEELVDFLSAPVVVDSDAMRFVTAEPLFCGYMKVDHRFGMEMPDFDGCVDGLFFEHEKINHPEVVHWVQSNDDMDSYQWQPYPNFSKRYSLVYKTDFHELSVEWHEAALWFYRQCKVFFEATTEPYHSARVTQEQIDQSVEDYRRWIGNKTHQQVSTDYNYPFDVDVRKMAIDLWEADFKQITKFIDETIAKLEADIVVAGNRGESC